MGHIEALFDYPLTGAQARGHEAVEVGPCGILEDRRFVLGAPDPRGDTLKRVSQSQVRELAQLSVSSACDENLLVIRHDGVVALRVDWPHTSGAEVEINEFDELAPAVDVGEEAAEWFEDFTGIKDIRLLRKTDWWQQGCERDPATTIVAPLHIVTSQTLAYAAAAVGTPDVSYADRFRPNIVLDMPGERPFAENHWQEVQIGQVTLRLARLTERCPVPGNDQKTGEKRGDLPRVYPQFPRSSGGKTVFGVYMYPQVAPYARECLRLADSAEVMVQT